MGIIARIRGEEPGILKKIPHARQGKGHYGEYLTEYALEHGKLGEDSVFSNVIVPMPSKASPTTEIDVVMLHEKGVFVFESKNYSGWIFGSADQQKWTLTLNAETKQRFYNPIMQNRTHIKALSDYLQLDASKFKSYIVFSERCELKSVPPDTAEYIICRRHHLLANLRKDLSLRKPVFDEEALKNVRASFAALAAGSTQEAREAHVERAQRIATGTICPWCGSQLVRRNGKYSPFLGCSAYPQCRFTRNL